MTTHTDTIPRLRSLIQDPTTATKTVVLAAQLLGLLVDLAPSEPPPSEPRYIAVPPLAPRQRSSRSPKPAAVAKVARARKPVSTSTRLPRRCPGDVEALVGRITELLKASPDGLRAEVIRERLGVSAKELPTALKGFKSTGQKRATTYYVGARPVATAKPRRVRKARSASMNGASTSVTV